MGMLVIMIVLHLMDMALNVLFYAAVAYWVMKMGRKGYIEGGK